MSDASADTTPDIVAKPGRYYRNARYLICAMTLLAGFYFAYDGFYNWPRQRREFDAMTPDQKAKMRLPENDRGILVNQLIACGLIPLSPILLVFFLYRSRGEYRLSGSTLHVPGHPPVSFEAITALDKTRWDRKGIVGVEYRLDGQSEDRRLTLDDFVYDQVPTDQIVERLEAYMTPEDSAEATAGSDESITTDDSSS